MSRPKPAGHIERRGHGVRVHLCVAGTRYRFTLATTDRREAARWAENKYTELTAQAQRVADGFPGPVPMSALLDVFEREELPAKSPGCRRSYADSLKPIRHFFTAERADPTVDRVRAADVDAFMTWRRAHTVTATTAEGGGVSLTARPATIHGRTVEKDRAVLHAIFALAERREYRDGNPVKRTKRPKYDDRQPILLSDAQYAALLEACRDDVLRLYVLMLGETGARDRSEALWLRWEDVNFDGDAADGTPPNVHFVSGRGGHRLKGGRDRFAPMTPPLLTAMRAHFAKHRLACNTPWVFHHDVTRRRFKAGDRIQSMHYALMSAARRAKVPAGWHPHDLRHRRVTTWLAGGASVVDVKEAVGHSDLRTTMGYTHLAKQYLRGLAGAGNGVGTNRDAGRKQTQSVGA